MNPIWFNQILSILSFRTHSITSSKAKSDLAIDNKRMWREDSETFRVPFHEATDRMQQPITCYKMWIVGDELLRITWCVQTASQSVEILANYGKSFSSMSERLWEICKRMSLKNMEEQKCLCVEFSQMTCLMQEDHSVFCGLYKTRASSQKTRGFNNFLCKWG